MYSRWQQRRPRAKVRSSRSTVAGLSAAPTTVSELWRSERLFRSAFELSPVGTLIVALDGRLMRVNAAFSRLLGYSIEQLLTMDLLSLTHPDDLAKSREALRSLIAGERSSYRLEERYLHQQGQLVWADVHTYLCRNQQGEPLHFITSVQDITERKRADLEQRKTESLLSAAAENLPLIFYVIGRDGIFKLSIGAGLKGLGLAPNQLVGQSVFEVYRGNFAIVEAIRKALAGDTVTFESEVGDARFLNYCVPFLDPLGAMSGTAGVAMDISERHRMEHSLRESEAIYRALVLGLPDVVMRFDRDGRHLFASDNVSRVTDLLPSEFLGKTHRELGFAEAESKIWEESIARVFETGAPVESEFAFKGKGGQIIFNWRLVPERNVQGQLASVLSIARDVTAQRKAEADYQLLFREMPDGVAVHQIICNERGEPVDYRFLSINPAFERLTGLKAATTVGRTALEVLPGLESHWIEAYGKVALTGQPTSFESFVAELGKHFWVTAFCPLPGQFVCIFADVTERRRTESALRESQERLQSIIDNASSSIYVKDLDGRLTLINHRVERSMGLPRDQILGKTCHDLFPKHNADTQWANDQAVLVTRAAVVMEEQYDEPDGVHTYLTTKFPLFAFSGEITGVCSISTDITERKQAEAERARLEEQLQQAQKMESVGRLAGGVAHDFNNMLGVILGSVELAAAQADPSRPIHSDLMEIRKAAERSADLTEQLLAFARRQTVAPKLLDLNDTIANLLKMLKRLIGEDIELDWKPARELWRVKMDPSQFNQILTNLCVNARDAIQGVGTISIVTENRVLDASYCAGHAHVLPGEYVMLTVRDSGSGMSAETLTHIFEPFFTTKRVGEGTGLGLAIVYGAVSQNGGFLDVTSELHQGTTFSIYLPRNAGNADTLPVAAPDEPAVHEHATILLVEDEPLMLRVARRILEGQGYTVLAAGSPREALRLAAERTEPIQLLVTDVIMPEMNGRELSKRLLASNPHMKRLFMSGHTTDVVAMRGTLDVGTHFIEKPFFGRELVAKVQQILQSPSEGSIPV